MSNDIDLKIVLNLTECPFYQYCYLPKIHFLCRIPECKTYPEYLTKLEKIK